MSWRRASLGPLLVALLAVPVAAAELESSWRHWSHLRPVALSDGGGEQTLLAIPVDAALYAHARSDLADLRLLDDTGAETGYALYTPGGGPPSAWRATSASDYGFVAGAYTQVVADLGPGDELHDQLEIDLGADAREVFTWVEVAASADRRTWRILRRRAPIYRFREEPPGVPQSALAIRYPATRDRWLRLRLLNPDSELPVGAVRVRQRRDEASERIALAGGLAPAGEAPAGESRWLSTAAAAGVPIAAVRFDTARQAFHRPVVVSVGDDDGWRQVARGLVYRYPDEESGSSSRESTRVEVPVTAAARWRVEVLDGNDPPIPDLEATLERDATFVVFRPRPGVGYRLIYGNPSAAAPSYELARLTSREALARAPRVAVGPEVENTAYRSAEPFTERHPVLLWLALGLVLLVLGALALKSLR